MALNINGGLTLTTGSVFQSDSITRSSVQWSSSLSFIGSAQNIPIQGSPISVTSSTVTLDTADSTYDRFDLIIISASEGGTGTLEKITGTPSADPQYPTYNSTTQAPLKYVKVKANATVPSSAGINPYDAPEDFEFENVLVYNENTGTDGSPSEWNHYPSSSNLNGWLAFDGSNHDGNIPTENSYLNTDESKVGSTSVKISMLWDNPSHTRDTQLSAYNTFAPAIFQYLPSEGNLYTIDRLAGLSFWIKLEKDLRVFDPVLNVYIHTLQLGYDNEALRKTYGVVKLKFNTVGIDRGNTSEWQLITLNADELNLSGRYINNQHVFYRVLIEPRFYGAIPSTPDWYVYLDNIQFHLGSMPSDEVLIGNLGTGTGGTGTGGNTGGGSNVYKQGLGPNNIRPTAGTHKVGALSYSSTIGGGNDNTITGSVYSFIGAGYSNEITGSDYSSLLGGRSNTVQADYSSILGGQSNCLTHDRSFIIGSNLTSDKACYTFMNNLDVAGVVSGSTFSGSFVGDGSGLTGIGGSGDITRVSGSGTVAGITLSGDTLSGDACLTLGGTFSTTTSSIVNFPTEVSRSAAAAGFGSGGGGGSDSDWYDGTTFISSSVEIRVDGTISGSSNIIIGSGHTDNGTLSTLVGGSCNTICSNSSSGIVLGGSRNCLSGSSSIIIGGAYNQMHASVSLIGGGSYNCIKPTDGGLASAYSTIVGGLCNCILSPDRDILDNLIYGHFIGGGIQNRINTVGNGEYNSIVGGRANIISGSDAGCTFIGSGNANLISGSSANSAILGGQSNRIINHEKTFIVGSNIYATAACTTYVNNLNISGSTTTNGILQLTRRETTPTGVEGMIISSGSAGSSKLYYYDGSSWNALF